MLNLTVNFLHKAHSKKCLPVVFHCLSDIPGGLHGSMLSQIIDATEFISEVLQTTKIERPDLKELM